MQSEDRDPFAEIVGRALMEPGYRDQLREGSNQERIATLVAAGLTHEDAEAVIPLLDRAVAAVDELAGHSAFGVRITAA